MNKKIKVVLLSTAFLLICLFGCGQKIDPKPYIMQAEKCYDSANTPQVNKYASELIRSAETALNEAKTIESDKEADKAVVLATKAEIYAKVSMIMAESKAAAESEINKAKEAEVKAKAEIEKINAKLQKAKILLPILKADIEKIINEFENLFAEKKEVEKSEIKPAEESASEPAGKNQIDQVEIKPAEESESKPATVNEAESIEKGEEKPTD